MNRIHSPLRTHSYHDEENEENSDEDDIFIVADDSSSPPSKRARSEARTDAVVAPYGGQDIDMDVSSDRVIHSSSLSADTATPAPPRTIGSSTNSTLTSLPLSGSVGSQSHPSASQSTLTTSSAFDIAPRLLPSAIPPAPGSPPPASREEKAVAALSLALANGAGLNDYGAVREVQETLGGGMEAEFHVGDLWH